MLWLLSMLIPTICMFYWLKPFYAKLYAASSPYNSDTRMDGKTVIITGANRGIGFATAIDLAHRGARVILACRNMDAANEAVSKIVTKTDNQQVTAMKLDLASFASIRSFVQEFEKKEQQLHVLINNAAMLGPETRQLTEDGNEIQFQSNHLGPFLLTCLLLPLLRKSAPSRIVMLSSLAHRLVCKLDFENLNSEKSYNSFNIYNRSKLCALLFTRHLSDLLKGTKVTINAVHPGITQTQLVNSLVKAIGFKQFISLFFKLTQIIGKTEKEGCQTTILVAVDPALENTSGKYFNDGRLTRPSFLALNSELAQKLWIVSMNLCKLTSEDSSKNL